MSQCSVHISIWDPYVRGTMLQYIIEFKRSKKPGVQGPRAHIRLKETPLDLWRETTEMIGLEGP